MTVDNLGPVSKLTSKDLEYIQKVCSQKLCSDWLWVLDDAVSKATYAAHQALCKEAPLNRKLLLSVIARHHSFNAIKAAKRRRRYEGAACELLGQEQAANNSLSQILMRETIEILDPQLTARQQVVLKCAYKEMTREDIAYVLGCSIRTVGNEFSAIRKLIESLSNDDDDGKGTGSGTSFLGKSPPRGGPNASPRILLLPSAHREFLLKLPAFKDEGLDPASHHDEIAMPSSINGRRSTPQFIPQHDKIPELLSEFDKIKGLEALLRLPAFSEEENLLTGRASYRFPTILPSFVDDLAGFIDQEQRNKTHIHKTGKAPCTKMSQSSNFIIESKPPMGKRHDSRLPVDLKQAGQASSASKLHHSATSKHSQKEIQEHDVAQNHRHQKHKPSVASLLFIIAFLGFVVVIFMTTTLEGLGLYYYLMAGTIGIPLVAMRFLNAELMSLPSRQKLRAFASAFAFTALSLLSLLQVEAMYIVVKKTISTNNEMPSRAGVPEAQNHIYQAVTNADYRQKLTVATQTRKRVAAMKEIVQARKFINESMMMAEALGAKPSRVELKFKPAADLVPATAFEEAIQGHLNRAKERLENCHNMALHQDNKKSGGTLKVSITTHLSGMVDAKITGIQGEHLDRAELKKCVVDIVEGIRLPKPLSRRMINAQFTIKFKADKPD